ncbi:MAG: hypothetical protein U0796_00830 [Gemmatales bacterium]
MSIVLLYFVISFLHVFSDRVYDRTDLTAPIITKHHKANLLIYVPPGRQVIVSFDLTTMTCLGCYPIRGKVEFPKTREGLSSSIMRFVVPDEKNLANVYTAGKASNLKHCVVVVFSTHEAGLIDLHTGTYVFLNNKSDF